MSSHEPEPKQFNPKQPVQLDPPKDDPITYEELSKCDGECIPPSIIDARKRILIAKHPGTDPSRPTLVAIKGVVFDVSRNPAYGPEGQYRGMFITRRKFTTRSFPAEADDVVSLQFSPARTLHAHSPLPH